MKRILVLAISLLSLCGCFKKPLRVAVIDSGISNVSGSILVGHNYIDDSDDTTDTQGHGSMLAEIIVSYAPDCSIIPLKVSCEDPKVSDFVIQAIQDCISIYDVDIICMAFSIMESDALHEVIQKADKQGVIMVSAAGNTGNRKKILYPSGYEEVISVGALDADGNPASYSMVEGVDVFMDGTWNEIHGTSVSCAKVTGMFASGKWKDRSDLSK